MTTRELRDDLRDAISNLRANQHLYQMRPDWATPATRQRAVQLRGVILDLWPKRHGLSDRLTPERENEIRASVAGAEKDKEDFGIDWCDADLLADLLAELDACRRDLAEERARTTRLTEALRDYDGIVKQATMELGQTNGSKIEFEELIADAVEAMRALRRRRRKLIAKCGAGTEQPA